MANRDEEASTSGDTPSRAEPPRLDLGQFDSLKDAFAKVRPGDRYFQVGKIAVPGSERMGLTYPVLFWFSMLTRAQGLHEAIAREIANGNPHAVFPLIRALVESLVLVMYVLDHPEYVEALTDHPRNFGKEGPKRKSIQALIFYASKHAPYVKDVYANLSEATHFGAIAMWAPVRPEEPSEGGPDITWASVPRWRSNEQALIACAQTMELAEGMTHFLRLFAERYVLPQQRGAGA